MSSSFATRTLPARVSDGWPWRAPYRRTFLLALAGVALAAVNAVLLRAAWALGTGPEAWAVHVERLRSIPALALHVLLCAIACGFAWGVVQIAARLAGGERRKPVLAGAGLAIASVTALAWALCSGVLA